MTGPVTPLRKRAYRPRSESEFGRVPRDRAALLLYVILASFFVFFTPLLLVRGVPDPGPTFSVVGNCLSGILVVGVGIPLMRTWRRRSKLGRTGLLLATAIFLLVWTCAWTKTWWCLLSPYHSSVAWGL